MSTEPSRAANVPADARWNAKDEEWELGEFNADGKRVGEWHYWDASDGHLICHSTFTSSGSLAEYTRYHPNGEPSQRGRLDDGKWIEQCWMRSTAQTTERWEPWGQPANCWMAKKIIGSVPIEFEYFDKEGYRLNAAGERMDAVAGKDFSKYLQSRNGETTQQALERYQAFFDAALGRSSERSVDSFRLTVHGAPATQEEMARLEERVGLGVPMPAAWVKHVTSHGTFELGGHVMIPVEEVTALVDRLAMEMECDPDEVSDNIDLSRQLMKRSVCFCRFDSEMVCFRFDVEAEADPPIATLYHDDVDSFEEDHAAISFDEYVVELVNDTIRQAAKMFDLTC
jgi:hypothetical protein